MPELYTTLGESTLASSYTAGGTSIVVASAASFPTAGTFRVRVDDEIFRVTAVSGATFTVVGATEGTTAANHNSAADITEVLTAAALDGIRSDISQSGLVSAIPGATKAGNLYFPTDGIAISRDTGAAQQRWGPIFPQTTSLASSFSWSNQGPATVSASSGSEFLWSPSGGVELRTRYVAAPATPYTLTAWITPMLNHVGNSCFIGFHNISTGGTITFGYSNDNPVKVASIKFSSPNNYAGEYFRNQGIVGLICLRLTDDGTLKKGLISVDGVNFVELMSMTSADFFTPTGLNWGAYSNSAVGCGVLLNSWVIT